MSVKCGARESDPIGARTCLLDMHVFGRHRSDDGREWRDVAPDTVTVGRAEILSLADRLRQTDSFNAQSVGAAVALNLDKMASGSSRSTTLSSADTIMSMIVGGLFGALFGPAIIARSQDLSRRVADQRADECEAAKTASKKRHGKIVKGGPKKKRKIIHDRVKPPTPKNRRKAKS